MSSYLPSRKVVAACVVAVAATVGLVVTGNVTEVTLATTWGPVAAAYAVKG